MVILANRTVKNVKHKRKPLFFEEKKNFFHWPKIFHWSCFWGPNRIRAGPRLLFDGQKGPSGALKNSKKNLKTVFGGSRPSRT
jgi:hypothetical protein